LRDRQLPIGLAIGTVLDRLVPDPRRGHPVALFGQAATRIEQRMWADCRSRGVVYTAVCVGAGVVIAEVVDRRSGRLRWLTVAATTWAVLGSRSLQAEGRDVHRLLADGDLPGARAQVTHLVGRDPSVLDEAGVARAALESVAENTCDAVVAPLFWGAVAGLPGLVGYRAINTLDAMVGHRSPRYERFGWASARLDDVANLVPARLTALLVAVVAPLVGGRPGVVLRTVRRDGRAHPSPNSGMSEAAFAGALGIELGGRNVYAGRVEDRPVMGVGPAARAGDLERAVRLCGAVTVLAAIVAAGLANVLRRPR
jgi:adenosylcobinamide-phosphate synthase